MSPAHWSSCQASPPILSKIMACKRDFVRWIRHWVKDIFHGGPNRAHPNESSTSSLGRLASLRGGGPTNDLSARRRRVQRHAVGDQPSDPGARGASGGS